MYAFLKQALLLIKGPFPAHTARESSRTLLVPLLENTHEVLPIASIWRVTAETQTADSQAVMPVISYNKYSNTIGGATKAQSEMGFLRLAQS